jgi:hypothetical protein
MLEESVMSADFFRGWRSNPVKLIQMALDQILALQDQRLEPLSVEVALLSNDLEELISYSQMAEWEQYLASWEQEEAFRKKCYEKLQRVKEFLKEHKKLEEEMWKDIQNQNRLLISPLL